MNIDKEIEQLIVILDKLRVWIEENIPSNQ